MAALSRIAALVVFMALAVPSQASAGGWWNGMSVSPTPVAPGQRVKVSTYVHASTRWGTVDRGPYFVYLLRGFDYSVVQRAMRTGDPGPWWSVGNADAIRVARVRSGRVSFTVPPISPGTYDLMLCDNGCRHPLGDLVPARITVVADRRMAEHAQRLHRLEARLDDQARLLRAARLATTNASLRLDELQAAVRAATRREQPERDLPFFALAGWLVAGLLVGAFAGVAALRRGGTRTAVIHPTRPDRSSATPTASAARATRARRAPGRRSRRART
jgi:hypothetical protein